MDSKHECGHAEEKAAVTRCRFWTLWLCAFHGLFVIRKFDNRDPNCESDLQSLSLCVSSKHAAAFLHFFARSIRNAEPRAQGISAQHMRAWLSSKKAATFCTALVLSACLLCWHFLAS
jgi:hypothetical protein